MAVRADPIGERVSGHLQASTVATMGGLVRSGLGVAVLPVMEVAGYGLHDLQVVALVEPRLLRRLGLVHPVDRQLSPAAELFAAVARASLARPDPIGRHHSCRFRGRYPVAVSWCAAEARPLAACIAAAGAQRRISCFQICDWMVPMEADPLVSRGMMGDGVIDFGAIASMVDTAGYSGDIEVEIFNETIWATGCSAVLKVMKQRYRDLVLPAIGRSG